MCTSFRYTPKVAKAFGLEEKDIHPSDKCLVLTRNQKKMVPFGYKTNNLILNARQETLLEKPLFKDSMHCIVPAGSFYEWDLGKNKVEFYCDHILYFAGILIDDHLVIVTTIYICTIELISKNFNFKKINTMNNRQEIERVSRSCRFYF